MCNRQEYATIAGMIVTQYGRPVPFPAQGGELNDRGSQVSSALDQLRGYYGLGSASPSGPGPDYFRSKSAFACTALHCIASLILMHAAKVCQLACTQPHVLAVCDCLTDCPGTALLDRALRSTHRRLADMPAFLCFVHNARCTSCTCFSITTSCL